jgi:hypothetical protein
MLLYGLSISFFVVYSQGKQAALDLFLRLFGEQGTGTRSVCVNVCWKKQILGLDPGGPPRRSGFARISAESTQ